MAAPVDPRAPASSAAAGREVASRARDEHGARAAGQQRPKSSQTETSKQSEAICEHAVRRGSSRTAAWAISAAGWPRRGADHRPPWAGRSSPRCRSRRPGGPARRQRPARLSALGVSLRSSATGIQADTGRRRRKRPRQRSLRQQHRARPASASMKASRSARIGRVQRHVGAAGLEDGEHADDQLRTERSTQRPTAPPARRRSAAGGCASRLARSSSSP